MKITKIRISNLLGISNFVSDKLGKFNLVEGDNEVGKSSLLKAITIACAPGGIKPKVISTGKDKAEILIEIDNRIQIQRDITRSGDTRKVVVDGEEITTAVTFLKTLFGKCSLDPTEFVLSKERERRQMLLSAIDFTFSKQELVEAIGDMKAPISLDGFDYAIHGLLLLEQVKSKVYDLRKEENRDIITLTKAIEQDKKEIPPTFDVKKFAKFNMTAKMDKLDEAKDQVALHEADERELNNLRGNSKTCIDKISEVENQISEMENSIVACKEELENLNERRMNIQSAGKDLKEKISEYVEPDTQAIRSEIEEFHTSQKLINKIDQIKEREKTLAVNSIHHEQLDDFYKVLGDDIQKKLMAKVDLPIDGLAIDGDDITIDGKSIDTISTSEGIRFGIQLAKALAQEMNVILVDRWESLSLKNQKIFEKETDGDGFQYVMTEVTEGELKVNSRGTVENKPKAKPKKKAPKKSEPKPEGDF